MPFTGGFSSGFSTGFAILSGSYSVVGSGGVTIGGSSPVTYTRAYSVVGSGGVQIGGSSPITRGVQYVGSGGVIVGGGAAPVVGRVVVGSGGITIGGSSPVSFYRAPTITIQRGRLYTGTGVVGDRTLNEPSEGVIVSRAGAAGVLVPREEGAVGSKPPKPPTTGGGQLLVESWFRAGSGGVRVGGASPVTFYSSGGTPIPSPTSYNVFGTGGINVAGSSPTTASYARRYSVTGSGGVRVAGSSPVTSQTQKSYARTGSGGILIRGASPVTYTPVPTVPGGGGGTGIFRTPIAPNSWAASRVKPVVTGATWNVSTTAQMQNALNNFAPNDEIVIAVGADISGEFVLPARNGPGQWLTIRTAAATLDTVCPQGRRMTPGKASTLNLGKLRTPGSNAAVIRPAPGAQGFYFIGIDFRLGGAASAMIHAGNVYMTSAAEMSGRMVFDRCLGIGGTTWPCNRMFYCCGEYIAVFDSWIADFYGTGDTQGILVAGWQGPYYFDNNHVEGWSENFMAGGAESNTPASDARGVPSDIVFTHNHVIKNMAYRNASPFGCTVKNLAELKSARRVEMSYNILEYTWSDGQSTPVNFKSVDQGGTHPLQGTQDVHFHHNWIRYASGGPTYSANPQNPTYAINPMHRLYSHDNLWEYLNTQPNHQFGGVMLLMSGEMADITVEHETFVVATSGGGVTAFVVEPAFAIGSISVLNNILCMDGYGMKMSGMAGGASSWNAYIPNAAHRHWDKNVLVGLGDVSNYPPGSIARVSDAAVGYANLAGRDYTVTGSLATAATDGGPVGVSNFAALTSALAPVLNG